MRNVDDLSDAAVTAALSNLLAKIGEDIIDMDDSVQREVLGGLVDTLDFLDGDDAFGTQGWRYRYGQW